MDVAISFMKIMNQCHVSVPGIESYTLSSQTIELNILSQLPNQYSAHTIILYPGLWICLLLSFDTQLYRI